MADIQSIIDNAPEGATHYQMDTGEFIESYLKFTDDDVYWWTHGQWSGNAGYDEANLIKIPGVQMREIRYTKTDLEHALTQIFDESVFVATKEGSFLPTICDLAAIKILVDDWSLDQPCVEIIKQALKDLDKEGCFNYADEQHSSQQ